MLNDDNIQRESEVVLQQLQLWKLMHSAKDVEMPQIRQNLAPKYGNTIGGLQA